MSEREGLVTLQGNAVTLVGKEIKVGDKAPDFDLVTNEMGPAMLANYRGKILIITAVPSLDTPVCDMETRKFNEAAASLGNDIKILTVSVDLPFAQARWCGAAGVEAVQTLSDYRSGSFGESYGILIKGLRLLARAVFVVDKAGIVQYAELVKEVAEEPDYDAALEAAKKLV